MGGPGSEPPSAWGANIEALFDAFANADRRWEFFAICNRIQGLPDNDRGTTWWTKEQKQRLYQTCLELLQQLGLEQPVLEKDY